MIIIYSLLPSKIPGNILNYIQAESEINAGFNWQSMWTYFKAEY